MNSNCGSGVSTTLLLDAMTGERLSPISQELAPVIAQQYVRAPATVTGVDIERYTPRKRNVHRMPCVFVSTMPMPRKSCWTGRPGTSSKTKVAGGGAFCRDAAAPVELFRV